MGLQAFEKVGMQARRKRPLLRGVFLREIAGKNRNVFTPFTQRRKRKWNHIETVVKIGAKLSALYHGG